MKVNEVGGGNLDGSVVGLSSQIKSRKDAGELAPVWREKLGNWKLKKGAALDSVGFGW